ncbi:hypothetical protein BGZ65_004505, partial [Modicella reniformis]
GYGPGNLRQHFTPDDDLKWICADHYPEDHREVIEEQQELDIVGENLEDPLQEKGPLLETGKHHIDVDQAILSDLRDPRWMIREKALIALNVSEPLSEATLQAILGAVKDEEQSVRETAIRVLGEQAKVSDMALRELVDITVAYPVTNSDLAYEVLNGVVRSESGIQRLIEMLQDEDYSVRLVVLRVLRAQARTSQTVVDAFAGAVRDKHADVNKFATKVLEVQNTFPETAIRILIGTLQDKNSSVRIDAARLLRSKIRSFSIAEEALVGAIRDTDSNVRLEALGALGDLEMMSEFAVQGLVREIQDESHLAKEEVRVLCHHSRSSPPAISALVSIISDTGSTNRLMVLNILNSYADLQGSVVLALVELLKDEARTIRRAATRLMLHNIEKLPNSAILTLTRLLEGDDQDVRRIAVRILGRHVRSSTAARRGADGATRHSRMEAKGRDSLSELSESALQVVIATLIDKDSKVRTSAANI